MAEKVQLPAAVLTTETSRQGFKILNKVPHKVTALPYKLRHKAAALHQIINHTRET